MEKVIIIGYGNELRGDDALGSRVVAVIGGRFPNIEAIAVPQLSPELAEPLAGADRAIFVDAAVATHGVSVSAIAPQIERTPSSHFSEPAALLALAQSLFGHAPPAWLVSVPGTDFALGDKLSAPAAEKLRDAIAVVASLLEDREHV